MQDTMGVPKAQSAPGYAQPRPSEELDMLLDNTMGDFRTLLAFEESAAGRHKGDPEACPYFRSLRRGGGHIMWNLAYGPFAAGRLLDPPLTPRPQTRAPQQQRDLDAGAPALSLLPPSLP